jgi:hypothetical protein
LTGKFRVGHGSVNWYNMKLRDVESVIRHEQFNFATFENDIALLKVKDKFVYTRGSKSKLSVVPICLANSSIPMLPGHVSVAGWGSTDEAKYQASNSLLHVKVDRLPEENCKRPYVNFSNKSMLCAGVLTGGHDACQVLERVAFCFCQI